MEVAMCMLYAYLYILFFEILAKDGEHKLKYVFVVLLGITRFFAYFTSLTKYLEPVISFSLLVVYSICIKSRNSNLRNLKYAIVARGICFVIYHFPLLKFIICCILSYKLVFCKYFPVH